MSRVFNIDYIPDPKNGKPLRDAKVYIGNPNTDPTDQINQISLFGDIGFPLGSTINLTQPVYTDNSGMTVYNKSTVLIKAPEQNYAMQVFDSFDNLVYNFPNISGSASIEFISEYVTSAQEELLPPGSQIYPDDGSVLANGMTVTAGTTHLRVLVGGETVIFRLYNPLSTSGSVDAINVTTAPYAVTINAVDHLFGSAAYTIDDIRYFGAEEGLDNRASIIMMQNRRGFVDVSNIDLLVSSPILASEITSPAIILKGNKKNYIRTTLGTTNVFDIDGDLDTFVSDMVNYTTIDTIVDTSLLTASVGKIRLSGNNIHDVGQGFIFEIQSTNGVKILNNDFKSLSRSTRTVCAHIGNSNDVTQATRGDYIVTGNTVDGVESTISTAETHAFILFGTRSIVSNNTINDISNGGTEGAEAIYIETIHSTVSNNTITDGGYSTNGAIAIKGDTRGEANGVNDGYNVSVTGNTIKFYTFTGGMGIYVANESATITGNTIEGDSESAILITAQERGRAINIQGNTISRSRSRFPIYNFSDTRELNISENVISNCLYAGASLFSGIYIKALDNNTIDQLKVSDNIVTVASTIAGSSVYGVVLDTGSATVIKEVIVTANLIATVNTNGVQSNGILITGSSEINGLTVTSNRCDCDDNEFNIASGVTLNGDIIIDKSNKFSGVVYDLASSLTNNEIAQPLIQRNPVAISRTLTIARPGYNFKITKANPDANLVGFNTQGSDTFRNGLTVAQINTLGSLEVTCYEIGIWDITEGSPTFS